MSKSNLSLKLLVRLLGPHRHHHHQRLQSFGSRASVFYSTGLNPFKAIEGVKLAHTTAPVLVMPDYHKQFEPVADACGFGIGAALLQEGRPIAILYRAA